MSGPAYEPRMMAGRCNDGGRDGGRKVHAVAGGPWGWQPALCGARPGRKTNGWGQWLAPMVTCPKCQAKAFRLAAAAGPRPALAKFT